MEALLADIGVDLEALDDVDRRIDGWKFPLLMERGAARLGDREFGLHVAESSAGYPDLDVFSYLLATSHSWGQALDKCDKYLRLVTDLHRYEKRVEGDVVVNVLVNRAVFPERDVQLKEYVLALNWIGPRAWIMGHWAPAFVQFRHARQGRASEYERIFHAPVHFGTPRYAIGLPKTVLDTPLEQSNSDLAAILDRFADDLMARLPAVDDLVAEVCERILKSIDGGEAAIDDISQQMGMSTRTLQRRLTEQGTSYKELRSRVRVELAQEMLQRPSLTVAEIAFVLGFSEPAAFSRSFKNWSGVSPLEYRRGGQRKGD